VPVETCRECGFDGGTWTDAAALGAIARLPDEWRDAVEGVSPTDLARRPIAGTWSIAEYLDHVREVLFAMRFLVETALDEPGRDLGDPRSHGSSRNHGSSTSRRRRAVSARKRPGSSVGWRRPQPMRGPRP
jgi:hypothetical protein